MIRRKLNGLILKTYVNALADGKYTAMTTFTYVMGITLLMDTTSFAAGSGAGGNILQAATKLINDLRSTIVTVSTAAAVVGVGTGAFFKKFSLGRGDRIDTGNKLITNSIWGWILINGLSSILNWAGSYIGAKAN